MGFRDQNNKVAPIDDGGSFDTDTNVNSVTSTSEAAANALAAANSAAAALVSENAVSADLALTNADVVLTHADVVLTNADLALTNADVVLTHADVVLAEADKVQTGLDRIAVAADLVLTNQDTIDTAADLALTNADVVLTNADVVLTHADVVLAEADKVQTGLDRIATNADVVLTNADVNLTNADVVLAEADKVQTGLDRIAVAADLVLTNADVVLTHADVVLAEADKVQTGLDRVAAANSQAAAAVEASTATTKASEAAASASTAATQASNAATSATGASNSQIAAATSAASAAAVFDQFDDTYLGSKSTAPTVDNDGNTLVVGALYYNNATGGMFIWSGAEWVAASSAGGASLNNYHYTATSGQTAFSGTDENSNTLSYTVDNVIVTLNGVVLEDGTDYTATNGSVITLSVAAALSDELNVVAFKSFTTADMVSASNGGTFQGNVDFTSGIDVTGNITVTGTVDGRDVAADGTKLDGIEASADVTDTANVVAALTAGSNITIASDGTIAGAAQYTHPTHAGDDAAIDTGALSGATVISDLDFNITTDTLGHVTDANATVATRNLTLANLGYTGATDATNNTVANAALPKAGGTMTGVIAGFESTGIDDNATSTAITIDASENVGIGTAAPAFPLDVSTNSSTTNDAVVVSRLSANTTGTAANNFGAALNFSAEDASGSLRDLATINGIYTNATSRSSAITFKTRENLGALTERMRIDSSGNVGIGTAAPSFPLSVQSNSSAEGLLILGRSSDDIGEIAFRENDNSTALGELQYRQDHAILRHRVGDLRFATGGTSERMRLDASGNLLVGQSSSTAIDTSSTTTGYSFRADGRAAITRDSGIALAVNRLTNDGDFIEFKSDGTAVGSIGTKSGNLFIGSTNGSDGHLTFGSNIVFPANSSGDAKGDAIDLGASSWGRFKDGHFSGTVNAANFNTTSDATLKTNVETLTGSLDAVKSLRGVSYDWIESGGSEIGVIAQEVEAVLPDVVSTNDEGIKSVKYGNMVAVLIEAIKEQQVQIDELKSQINS